MNTRKKLLCMIIALMFSCVMLITAGATVTDSVAAPDADVTVEADAALTEEETKEGTDAPAEDAVLTTGTEESPVFSVDVDGELTDYDLTDGDSAAAYVDSYADNLTNDPAFKTHIETALNKVRESIGSYATWAALLAPIIAIVLALITKEVYSSLFVGVIAGALLSSDFKPLTTLSL